MAESFKKKFKFCERKNYETKFVITFVNFTGQKHENDFRVRVDCVVS